MADISLSSKKTKKVTSVRKSKIQQQVSDAEVVKKSSKKANVTTPLKKHNDLRGLSKFALITINGQQEFIYEGQELEVNHLGDKAPEIQNIALFVDGESILVGKPSLDNVRIELKSTGTSRGEKIAVREFKAKSRYRRAKGSRQTYTKIQIESIKAI